MAEKVAEGELELSEDEWRCLCALENRFIVPAKTAFSDFTRSIKENGSIVDGDGDSALFKRVGCLDAYVSALKQIGRKKKKLYSEAKTFLSVPTNMVIEFSDWDKKPKNIFGIVSEVICGSFAREVPRLNLCVKTFLIHLLCFLESFWIKIRAKKNP